MTQLIGERFDSNQSLTGAGAILEVFLGSNPEIPTARMQNVLDFTL